MKASRLVLIRVGAGTSISWEIERALETVPPERLLFLFHKRDFARFRNLAQPRIPRTMPEPASGFSLFRTQEYFLHFDADWTPRLVRLKNHAMLARGDLRRPVAPAVKLALRDVYAKLGVHWEPPPVPWLVYGIVVPPILALFAAIAWMIWSAPAG